MFPNFQWLAGLQGQFCYEFVPLTFRNVRKGQSFHCDVVLYANLSFLKLILMRLSLEKRHPLCERNIRTDLSIFSEKWVYPYSVLAVGKVVLLVPYYS